MLDISIPWWEPAIRATAIYLILLLLMRLSGKRSLGQLTPFDLLVIMLLSESVSPGLTGDDSSLPGGLIAAATLVLLNAVVGFVASRSRKFEKLVEGTAVLIGKDGTILTDVLRRHRISEADMHKSLREADCRQEEMHRAYLEADGSISVLKKRRDD